ncbi:MAG: hypothetical protein WKF78_03920 [Candidatus Limnocylindrales bacterium]
MIETAPSPMSPAPRKTNRLMADLARAMQVAAEAARTDTLARLSDDVKAHIEAIHAQAATDATDLRKQADDDVAAIRDRSKAEIARIRDETEGRITQRKLALDEEIEDHNATVEHRIERGPGARRDVRAGDGRVLRRPPRGDRPDAPGRHG